MVCTGNIARSPIGEALFERKLRDLRVDHRVASAGFVTEDRPADAEGIEVMAAAGIDLSSHRSRRVSPALVAAADLIVTMERQHVREIAVLDLDAFSRTFTLPELARRAMDAGPRAVDESVRDWAGRLSAGRRPSDLVRHDPSDEVADPHGRALAEFRRAAEEIDRLSTVVVNHLVPPAHRA